MSDGRQPAPLPLAELGDVGPDGGRSTKSITLYVNGDKHFFGTMMVVSRRLTQTWETFLREATQKTGVTYAVRDVLTPTHGTKINSLDELVDGSSYVVISKGIFKRIG